MEGLRLGDRYVLQERIASGGMADVWRALDDVLQRDVAVKVMRPDPDNEEIFAQRFRDEALHSAALLHANITTVFDYGEDDHLSYLVMELVPGLPLSALIREHGAMPPDTVRSILGQAALALGTAHEAGVVHRDVKPANILVREDGLVKLTDFGIARAIDAIGHTRVGEMLGTPNYISPEQAVGERATGASDLYALGVVGHEMLTGQRPFDRGTPIATAMCHVNEPPPPLGDDVPEDLREVVAALLQKDPADRPDNALTVAVMLGVAPAELVDLDVDLAAGVPSGYVVLPITPMTPPTPLEAVRPADRAPADMPTMAAGPEELLD
ncbi:serine/threonine-protein kinase [Nocardioides xinjiangensis]|uniref:serine/threonine-protein kinase n=1 Tax=Nocardioides xinjiangensis TaxID=2817376 RepID=UPI001B302CDF|nr:MULTISPECIES: serine/threonine-protein kinase [unclassified Nocardioides]